MSGELASFEVDGYQLVYQDLGEGTPVNARKPTT